MELDVYLAQIKKFSHHPKRIKGLVDLFVRDVCAKCGELCKDRIILTRLQNYDNGFQEFNGIGVLKLRCGDDCLRFPNYGEIIKSTPYLTEKLQEVVDIQKETEKILIENLRWRHDVTFQVTPKGGLKAKVTLRVLFGERNSTEAEINDVAQVDAVQICELLRRAVAKNVEESEIYSIQYGPSFHFLLDLVVIPLWTDTETVAIAVGFITKSGEQVADFSPNHKRIFLYLKHLVEKPDNAYININHELTHTFDNEFIRTGFRFVVPYLESRREGSALFIELIRSEWRINEYVNFHNELLEKGEGRGLEFDALYAISPLIYIQIFLLLIFQRTGLILKISVPDIRTAIKNHRELAYTIYRICKRMTIKEFVKFYKKLFYAYPDVSSNFFDFYQNFYIYYDKPFSKTPIKRPTNSLIRLWNFILRR